MPIRIPKKDNFLASFTGIMLGDGGVAPYHIHITLSNKEVKYKNYIVKLIKHLFRIDPKIHKLKYANAIDIVVQRKQLVDFCQSIGLVLGNKVKQQIDVPIWIKENKEFSKECLRGLIDTDGCFYTNTYFSNGKKYKYLKIAFTSASKPLISSVLNTLNEFGYKARITKDKKDVRIENSEHVLKYIQEIGTNNDKHLQKINDWKKYKSMLK